MVLYYKLLLIIQIIFQLTKAKFNKQIPLDQPQRGSLNSNQYHYYKTRILKKQEYQDLIFIVEAVHPTSKPELFISSINEFPSENENNYDQSCISLNLSVCSIDHNQIRGDQWFYIGVTCQNDCTYIVTAEYVPQNKISVGEQQIIYSRPSNSHQVRTFKLFIPKELNEDIQEIQIQTFVQQSQNYQNFSLFVQKGDITPSSQNTLPIVDLWHQGKSCFLTLDDSTLVFDYTYTILLEMPPDSFINISIAQYSKIRKIDLYEQVFDLMPANQFKKTYELTIDVDREKLDWENAVIDIQLIPFAGQSDLYVNPDKMVNTLNENAWFSTQGIREQVIVMPSDRQYRNMNTKTFYITINKSQKVATTYHLLAKPFNKNLMTLNFDFPVTGDILKDEIINFKHVVTGSKDMMINIDLVNERGNPDLFVKRCNYLKSSEVCQITKEDIKQKYNNKRQNSYEENDFFLFCNHIGSKDIISFQHKAQECFKIQQGDDFKHKTTTYECAYVVAVLGNNLDNYNNSQYTLIAKHDQGHQILREAIPDRNEVYQKGFNYYSFSIPQQMEQIKRIKILATEITGNIQLVTSYESEFPKLDTPNIRKSDLYQPYINYESTDQEKINGKTFFIGVYGLTQAEYIISIALEHQNRDYDSTFYLQQDQPQQIILHDKSEKAQFTFKSQQKADLTVWLKPMHGYYDIYLSPQKQYDIQNSYVWQASDNFLTIKNNDQSYPQNGQFYGIVVPKQYQNDNQNDESDNDDDNNNIQQQNLQIYDFQIGYHDSNSVITLKQDEVFSDFINYKEKRSYRFRVFKDQQIQITKKTSNDIHNVLSLYMSYVQNNKNPSEIQNNGILSQDNILTITKEQINSNCSFYSNNKSQTYENPCYIYLIAKSSQATYYNIYIDSNAITNIKEFQYLESPLPLGNIPKHFYMYTKGVQFPITISQYSINAETEIYAKLTERKLNEEKEMWSFPNKNENWEYKGENTNNLYNKIIITKDQLQRSESNCLQAEQGCVLLLSVYLKSDLSTEVLSQDTFFLSIFSIAQPLQEGIMVQSAIKNGEFQYYTIQVGEEDTDISVIVVPLDNEVDTEIYVKKGIEQVPTQRNFDWHVSYGKSKHLFFNPKYKFEQTRGTYTIGIYGHKGGQYQLYYHIDNFSLTKIQQGSQNEYSLKQYKPMYIEYTHYYNKDFKILNNISLGQIKIEITSKVTEQTYQKIDGSNQEEIDFQWSSAETNHPEYVKVQKSDPNFCYGFKCKYLIKITPLKDSNIITTIHVENLQQHLVDNSVTYDVLDNKYDFSIYKYINQKSSIKVSVNIIKGNVKLYVKEGLFISTSQYDKVFEISEESNSIVAQLFSQIDHSQSKSNYKYSDPFLFLIEAQEQNTIYTIQVQPDYLAPQLSIGKAYYDKLNPGQEQLYSINLLPRKSNENKPKKKQQYTLNVILHNSQFANDSFGNDYKPEDFHPKIQVEQSYNATEVPCKFFEDTKTSISCTFESENDHNLYYISVKNDKLASQLSNFKLEYNVVVTDSTLVYISPNHHYTQTTFQNLNSFYEIIPPIHSMMFIEIYQCYGEIDVTMAYNITSLENGNYDERLPKLASFNHYASVQKVKPDPLYIKVHTDRGEHYELSKKDKKDQAKNARYQIKVKFYPLNTKIPLQSFQVGLNNRLMHSINDYNLKLEFGNVYTFDNNQVLFKPQKVEYLVTITQGSKHHSQYASRCQYQLKPRQVDKLRRYLQQKSEAEDDQIETELEKNSSYSSKLNFQTYQEKIIRPANDIYQPETITANIDLNLLNQNLLHQQDTYFTVTAKITVIEEHSQQLEEFKFFYDIESLTPKQLEFEEGLLDKINWNYVIAGISLYIVTFITVVCVCYKLRKTREQLKSQRTEIGQSLQDVEMTHNKDKYKSFTDETN